MYFKQLLVGGFDKNFSYFVGDDQSRNVIVVDPANIPLLKEHIKQDNLNVVGIFLTHGHFDHINETATTLKVISSPTPKTTFKVIYCHKTVKSKLRLPEAKYPELKDGGEIKIDQITFKVIFTPGHEPGSICLLAENKLITGDTLFINGCGRTDLPGSDVHQLYNSLYNVISSLPDETEIYPGHDYGPTESATLGQQKKENHYLTCKNEEEFVNDRHEAKRSVPPS